MHTNARLWDLRDDLLTPQQEGSQSRFYLRKLLDVLLMSAVQTYDESLWWLLDNTSWTRLHFFVNVSLWVCYIWSWNFVLKMELKEALNLRFSVRLWLFSSGISHPGEKRRRSHQCRRTWGILERNWSRSSLSWLHVERVPVQELIQNHVSFQPQGKKVFCLIT